MTLAQSSRFRLVTFSALYLVQGIPTGFITITLAAVLGVVPLVLLYWLPPVSKKGKPAVEPAVSQNPS